MQVVKIDGINAFCETKGVGRDVNLFLLQDEAIKVGDYVLVHVGYAIQKVSSTHARSAWELYDEILAARTESGNA